MIKRIFLAVAISIFAAAPAFATSCSNTSPQLKDNSGTTFNAPYTDDGTGSGDCRPNVGSQSGAFVDGWDATQGSKSDTAWGGSGSGSVVAILKAIYAGITGAISAGTNFIGYIGNAAFSSNGWTYKTFVVANSDNATTLKSSAGVVHAVQVYGIAASQQAWLKFYDTSTTPTCGSSTIVKQILIPANSTGAGANTLLDTQFSTGISYCVTTGIANSDDTAPAASTYVVNLDYK